MDYTQYMLDTGAYFCLVAVLVALGFVDFWIALTNALLPEVFGLGLVVDPPFMAGAVPLHGLPVAV